MRTTLIALVMSLLGCATVAREKPSPRERPPSSAELRLNYQQAVELSSEAIAQRGISHTGAETAEEIAPNYWKVRFGLAPKGSGKVLEVYFDGAKHEVVKTEEVASVAK